MAEIYNNAYRSTIPKEAAYAGRPSKYGNPYSMRNDSEYERNRVCNLFEAYAIERLAGEPTWLDEIKGKDLICWCSPSRCHCETLHRLCGNYDSY
jgi:Domain of unknown function (DUF4326)